jgi:RNA polymerase sigma-70 factor (sigma-E family)
VDARQRSDFDEYVMARRDALVRLAFFLVGDVGRAEDIVQDVLVKAYLHWPKIERSGADAYVRQMIVNRHADVRRRWRWRDVLTSYPPAGVLPPDFEDTVPDRAVLANALAALSPTERLIVTLRFYLDLSEAETAAISGLKIGTVKSTGARGFAKLRRNPDLILEYGNPPAAANTDGARE